MFTQLDGLDTCEDKDRIRLLERRLMYLYWIKGVDMPSPRLLDSMERRISEFKKEKTDDA